MKNKITSFFNLLLPDEWQFPTLIALPEAKNNVILYRLLSLPKQPKRHQLLNYSVTQSLP